MPPPPAMPLPFAPAATSFSSSVEYPGMFPQASQPVPPMPYAAPSAAGYLELEAQPMEYPGMFPQASQPYPPMPYAEPSAAGYLGFEAQPMGYGPMLQI
ncbi:hypothetical protein JTE90_001369 [Oedothorax gibbosus]|uniref:Deleted in azoospermia-associated protein 2 n=1 Tax=Oedothorax gibbosus TaxID=931172 RepID=A0AAV6VH99_9ARAC|nr:hypothetical protein JTE90_001369 [Oedothorax gibbosus]